jgi:signal peptidase I
VRQEGPSLLATLALLAVLYVFVAEFRVVPTNSMRPGIAPADRLLVWKLGAGGTPDRFAILVFQVPKGPPLVKRVAGLSGEAVAIDRNGDLVVDGAVVVKPDDVREAMREPLVRADFTGPRVPDGWARGGDGALRYARPLFADDPAYLDERGVLELNPPERPLAHDVYVRARLAGPGELRLAFVDEQGRTTATYASGAAGAADVSIAVVDGRLWRNGRVVGPAEGARGHAEVSLSGGVASVEIDRDVHYTQPRDAQLAIDPAVPYRVPEGCVFMLGDHSAHSHDSRYADVGPISLQRVIGRVVFRVWPLPRLGRVP